MSHRYGFICSTHGQSPGTTLSALISHLRPLFLALEIYDAREGDGWCSIDLMTPTQAGPAKQTLEIVVAPEVVEDYAARARESLDLKVLVVDTVVIATFSGAHQDFDLAEEIVWYGTRVCGGLMWDQYSGWEQLEVSSRAR